MNEPLDTSEKEKIISLLEIYRNEDGTFPYISAYMLDNKQLLMHYTMMTKMGFQIDLTDYQSLLSDDFDNMDGYDLYAYVYFASRLNLDATDLKRKLVSELGDCKLEEKSHIGYILLVFSELQI